MKNFKYLVLVLFFGLGIAQAQNYRFKTSGFMVSDKSSRGVWSEWSKFQKSEMIISLEPSKNRLVIYSEAIQLFSIVKYHEKKETNDGNVISFQCVDNFGEDCEISIFTRKDKGNLKQLYIYYRDRIIAYNINLIKEKK